MSHTPTPQILIEDQGADWFTFANVMGYRFGKLTGASAAFANEIVCCVNAHDELVAALGMIERLLSSHCESNQADQYLDDDALDVARAALAKVQAPEKAAA